MSADDSDGWDHYWSAKPNRGGSLYDRIATLYRNTFIRPGLTGVVRRHFPNGGRLLHAGCGSGQVDSDLGSSVKVTALDLSMAALEVYARSNAGSRRVRASVFEIPFPDGTFDGAYNLGVIEHFDEQQIRLMLSEMMRVVKPGGKVIVFWPHTLGTSVNVLRVVHWVLHNVLKSKVQLHPPEISLVRSKRHAQQTFEEAGLGWTDYTFGPRDGFVQAIVVGEKKA